MTIKTRYEMVQDFHKSFEYPMSEKPTPMSEDMVLNRLGFIGEEMIELIHATADSENKVKELYGKLLARMDQSLIKQLKKPLPENILIAQMDACIDIDYFNTGNFTLLGVNPDPLFNIVHSANMGKLFSDGKPRYNEHGKIMKPEGWIAPEPLLEEEVNRQIEAAKSL